MNIVFKNIDITSMKFDDKGLVPVIVQDQHDGVVLMLAYMNAESFRITLDTGVATYWSRSRKKLWKKGETSGNVQNISEIYKDCDSDTLVIKVEQIGGAACHTGNRSCFYTKADPKIGWVEESNLVFDPKRVYKK